ncbi:hypothetical protein ADE_11600 [Achromobacter denitrificans]|uniref:TIR domain-containing protein n=1 Tax=Achromobacter denitrificans TaxID=32002 RepID=UPI0019A76BB8|nr:TIR domain-containing protein [Achromobacter denitrificans]GFN25462.1 hypothetical protein ADE_11600 [Achromobacter denitrificans]
MIIEGPSGIGKTSSVRRALERAGTSAARFLSARRPKDVEEIEELCEKIDELGLVIVDDFHRLPPHLKNRLGDTIKVLSDEENETSKLVLIGINRAGQSLIDSSPDLLHRVEIIQFGRTNLERIQELIEKGQIALNCAFKNQTAIAEEAEGSFAMAQVLCYEACLQANVLETAQQHAEIAISVPAVREAVIKELGSAFLPVARDFATGNKLRREGRAPYLHLLMWLSKTPDGVLDSREALAANPALRGSVSQVIEKGHLATLLRSEPRIGEMIHFDIQSQLLTTEDPKFLYFVRHMIWSKFARQVGYDAVEFRGRYDFALSFAGADRTLADEICRALQDRELHVFYDENESHRILGQDVEEYLAPIYRSEASYVVAMVSKDYPTRIWTKFESDQFKERFGSHSVIPVFIDGYVPPQWDQAWAVGYLTIANGEGVEDQIHRAVGMLCDRILDDRKPSLPKPDSGSDLAAG